MRRKGRAGYSIGVVAKMYGIHPQTLRTYEREGLLTPSRSQGNTRLFTDEDLERLDVILSLTRELGVNLAGVEVILNMRKRMENMEREVQELIDYLTRQSEIDPEFFSERIKTSLVRVPPSKIVRIRRK